MQKKVKIPIQSSCAREDEEVEQLGPSSIRISSTKDMYTFHYASSIASNNTFDFHTLLKSLKIIKIFICNQG
jgi:hypothetical protein